MKRQSLFAVTILFIIFSTIVARSYSLDYLSSLSSEDTQIKQEINNTLDYMMKNLQDYLTDPMKLSLWAVSKSFLGHYDNRTEIIDYFNSKQDSDGAWGGGGNIFTTHRVLLAYYILNATPARSLDAFFSNYDTWVEARSYMLLSDARNMYQLILAWVLYYCYYPPWMNDFFNEVETDLSWTNSSNFHMRTHIIYSYVIARRPFPNLDGIIDATISEQLADGKWDGSFYDFYPSHGDVYFTSIQISLLNQILQLYPNHRTSEILASLEKAKVWTNSTYHTIVLDEKVSGYFGDILNLEHAIFAGLLAAGQTGLIAANIDITYQDLYSKISRVHALFEYFPEKPITNENITFNASASSSPRGNIASYEWNFGDGNITRVNEPTIKHAFTPQGTYTTTLKVIDAYNFENITKRTITVYSLYIFTVLWQESKYQIFLTSNSTPSNLNFNSSMKQITYKVTGPPNTIGYCNISIPKKLMWSDFPSQWSVKINGFPINAEVVIENTNTLLYFTYNHSTRDVAIQAYYAIPEFQSTIMLLLCIVITLLGGIFTKKWSSNRITKKVN